MANIVAIIPARSGSKSLVDKNIKPLSGHPLIAYSIAAARMSTKIDRVVVSTNSQEYAGIAKQYGAEVPFIRPDEFSTDTATDKDFLIHAMNWLKENEGSVPEYWAHLRPTTPLRNIENIDNAIDAAIKEYGKPEFIITENPASIAKGGSISGNVLAKRSKGNINILLVDDNPKFLNALADRIKLQGYEPLTALNGKEALDIIQTKTVHLAIIDQRLPDMDGLALIGKLKEINASVHSSLLTGHGDEKLKEATEALKSFYFEKEDMGSFWGFFRKILNSLGSEDGNEQVIAQTFCVYSIE